MTRRALLAVAVLLLAAACAPVRGVPDPQPGAVPAVAVRHG